MTSQFKLKLGFLSLVKLCALIGVCAAVCLLPVGVAQILMAEKFEPIAIPFILVGFPVAGLLNGAFSGAVSYPVYWWVTEKISFQYTGKLYVSND